MSESQGQNRRGRKSGLKWKLTGAAVVGAVVIEEGVYGVVRHKYWDWVNYRQGIPTIDRRDAWSNDGRWRNDSAQKRSKGPDDDPDPSDGGDATGDSFLGSSPPRSASGSSSEMLPGWFDEPHEWAMYGGALLLIGSALAMAWRLRQQRAHA